MRRAGFRLLHGSCLLDVVFIDLSVDCCVRPVTPYKGIEITGKRGFIVLLTRTKPRRGARFSCGGWGSTLVLSVVQVADTLLRLGVGAAKAVAFDDSHEEPRRPLTHSLTHPLTHSLGG